MTMRNPLLPLVIGAAALLGIAAAMASCQTVPPERVVDLRAIACQPAEPPVSRLGCAP
ncbi:hypothetical protein [Acidisoma sp. 7E03]